MKIVSVLWCSDEFKPKHARMLHQQLKGYDSVCLTNSGPIKGVATVALQNPQEWRGWWAKMELFDPDGPLGKDDLLYFDIDTKIIGDITPLIEEAKKLQTLVMLSDFYHPHYGASGVMYIPAAAKRKIWKGWLEKEDWFRVRARRPGRVGDQGAIADLAPMHRRWDRLCPDMLVSYKRHVAGPQDAGYEHGRSLGDGTVPENARVICYHGNPRPWEI